MKFYITMGSEGHPFYGGWVEVEAESEGEARNAYNHCFPPINGFGRFCGCYSQETMESTGMLERGNFRRFCHATIKTDGKNIEYREVEE